MPAPCGRHERRRPQQRARAGHVPRRRVLDSRDAEVEHLHRAVTLQEEVRGLDVAMDDRFRVRAAMSKVARGAGARDGHDGARRDLEAHGLSHVLYRRPFEELHDQEGRSIVGDVVVEDCDRPRVLEAVGDVPLADEALAKIGAEGELGVEDLDGDPLLDSGGSWRRRHFAPPTPRTASTRYLPGKDQFRCGPLLGPFGQSRRSFEVVGVRVGRVRTRSKTGSGARVDAPGRCSSPLPAAREGRSTVPSCSARAPATSSRDRSPGRCRNRRDPALNLHPRLAHRAGDVGHVAFVKRESLDEILAQLRASKVLQRGGASPSPFGGRDARPRCATSISPSGVSARARARTCSSLAHRSPASRRSRRAARGGAGEGDAL